MTSIPVSAVRFGIDLLAATTLGTRFYGAHHFEQRDDGRFDVGEVEYETTIYAREV